MFNNHNLHCNLILEGWGSQGAKKGSNVNVTQSQIKRKQFPFFSFCLTFPDKNNTRDNSVGVFLPRDEDKKNRGDIYDLI